MFSFTYLSMSYFIIEAVYQPKFTNKAKQEQQQTQFDLYKITTFHLITAP